MTFGCCGREKLWAFVLVKSSFGGGFIMKEETLGRETCSFVRSCQPVKVL